MTMVELKLNFHKLIDEYKDDTSLSKFYEILSRTNDSEKTLKWNRLSVEEQQELFIIENESHDPNNLIPHSVMINKHQKWL
jgi:hypothetical protein